MAQAKLTTKEIEAAVRKRPQKKTKMFDGAGLFLEVPPEEHKSAVWRHKYRFKGKEKLLSLGKYPAVSLKHARRQHREQRTLLEQGINPSDLRKATKEASADTLEALALEWFELQKDGWTKKHAATVLGRLNGWVLPYIGNVPVTELSPQDVLGVIRRLEAQDKRESAHRVLSICGQVMRYAVVTGRATTDPTRDLRGALKPVAKKHLAAILDPKEFGELLRAIDAYKGHPTTLWALQLAPLVFVRPGELRQAEWAEVDLEDALWTIPASKMKGGRDHMVPLSTQAVALFKEAQKLTGKGPYVFPSVRTATRPMSDMTLSAALKRLGYTSDMHTVHGFRASARSMMEEQLEVRPELLEHQLAHAVHGPLGRAYNRATLLKPRREMMQRWADYLQGLKS
mgnify:FL=1